MTTEQLIAELRAQDPSGKGEVIIYGKECGVPWYCDIAKVDSSGPPMDMEADCDPVIEVGGLRSVG